MPSETASAATRQIASINAQVSNLNEQMSAVRANLSVAIDRSMDSLTMVKAKALMDVTVSSDASASSLRHGIYC